MSNTSEWLPVKLEAGAMDVFVARPSEPVGLGIEMNIGDTRDPIEALIPEG